jgi:hypothetical protein
MIVVLTILKWTGIVLLCLAGVLLLFFALLLFVPVRYMLCAECGEKMRYQFRVSWLYPFVYLRKRPDDTHLILRVFGIPVFHLSEREKKPDKQKTKTKPTSEKKSSSTENVLKTDATEAGKTESVSEFEPESGKKEKQKQKKHKKRKPKKNRFSFETLSGIISFIREETTRYAVVTLKNELMSLLRYLSPQRIEGEFRIGLDDPALTGLLIGGISLVPFFYQKGLQITPDFEERVFRGNGKIKGRIRVIYFVRLIIRIYRDDTLRQVWKQVNN